MKKFSVVIPILNMADFVSKVVEGLAVGPFGEATEEIIFVCDKSTDGTEQAILDLKKNRKAGTPDIVLVQPTRTGGHFQARYLGARAAKAKTVFFIDARVALPMKSNQILPSLVEKYPSMMANIDIDISQNIFCLYWQRSHESIFRKTYKSNEGINVVTAKNYDDNRLGTTCFYCTRDIFVRVCEKYYGTPLFSDDTKLLRDFVQYESITLHPDFRIFWQPRNQLIPFLKHLGIKRGPGFAEYHLMERRGVLFWAVVGGSVFALMDLWLMITRPALGFGILLGVVLLLMISTALIAKSAREFFILAPLHASVVISYGLGAIRGIFVVLRARRNKELR